MTEIVHRFLLQLPPDGVMGEPLDLLTKPIAVKLFYGVHDARVDVATVIAEDPAVGDVMRKGMLESVLQVGKELCRIKKLGVLQIPEQAAEVVLRPPDVRHLDAAGFVALWVLLKYRFVE